MLLFANQILLLLDRIQHRPENWFVVHHQVSLAVFRNRLRNYTLHLLGDQSNMFLLILDAQRILVFVAVTNRFDLQDLLQPGRELSMRSLKTAIRQYTPKTATRFVSTTVHSQRVVGSSADSNIALKDDVASC